MPKESINILNHDTKKLQIFTRKLCIAKKKRWFKCTPKELCKWTM